MNNNVSVMSVQTKADTKVSAGKTVTAGSKSKVEDFSQTFQEAKQEKGVKSDFKSNAKSETAGSAAEKAAELQEAAVKDAVNAVSDGTVKDSAAEDVPAENINTDTKGTVLEAGQLLTAMVMGVMAQPAQQNVQNNQMADGEKVEITSKFFDKYNIGDCLKIRKVYHIKDDEKELVNYNILTD